MATKKTQTTEAAEGLAPLGTLQEQPAEQGGAQVVESAQQMLLGSSVHPATVTINGTDHALGEFVAAAKEAAGLSVDDWNKLPGEVLDQAIDAAIVAAGGASSLPAAQAAPLNERVECAVLCNNIYGKHDDIIELPPEEAAAAAAAGYVDTHPNAIKALRGQG